MVVFGKTSRVFFAFMPDSNIGCHLVNLNDIYRNLVILSEVLGITDLVTVALALVF